MKKLTPKEASERLGLSEKTLAMMRCEGRGPVYLKMGGLVRYRDEDLSAFEEANVFRSVAESKRARAAEALPAATRARRGAA